MTNLPPALNAPDGAPETNGLHDIKPPVEIFDWLKFSLQCLAVLALVVAAYFLWKWWKKRQANRPAAKPVPPFTRVLNRLRESRRFLADPKIFCTEVSDAIRVYLEEEFHLPASERTTEEFLQEAMASPALHEDSRSLLEQFLTQCDLVKFARMEPSTDELEVILSKSTQFVEESHTRFLSQPGLEQSSLPK